MKANDRDRLYCSVRAVVRTLVRSPARIGASKRAALVLNTVMNEGTPETATTIAPIISRFYAYG